MLLHRRVIQPEKKVDYKDLMRGPTGHVVYDIILSRIKRIEDLNDPKYPSFVEGIEYPCYPPGMYDDLCTLRSKHNSLAFADLLLRSVSSLITDPTCLKSKLVDLAALCVAWAETLEE